MDPREREIEKLEEELDEYRNDPTMSAEDREKNMRLIRQSIREVQRDLADEQNWREEGYERGWR